MRGKFRLSLDFRDQAPRNAGFQKKAVLKPKFDYIPIKKFYW